MHAQTRYCSVCYDSDDNRGAGHDRTCVHLFNKFLENWNFSRDALLKNRHGCEIKINPIPQNEDIIYFESIQRGKLSVKVTPGMLASIENTLNFQCIVKNCRNSDDILLTAVKLLFPYDFATIRDPEDNLEMGRHIQLAPGAEYFVDIKFCFRAETLIGTYKIPACFSFQTFNDPPETFTILRHINISVEESTNNNEEEVIRSPFTNNDWLNHQRIVPPTQNRQHNRYPIPRNYWKFLKLGLQEFRGMTTEDHRIFDEINQQLEPGHISLQNYRQFWHIVLWLDEMGATIGLKRYNMENANVKRIPGDLLELMVPGLAEKRPSVIVGDFIELKEHDSEIGYRGVIRAVNDASVHIAFVDEEFLSNNPKSHIDVRFVLGRLPLERMHQAVDQVALSPVLSNWFSGEYRNNNSRQLSISEYYNPLIRNNAQQNTAVLNILNDTSGQIPYIVFGPPGTGKTMTIVEAILQIKNQTKKQILVCAPANAACDYLTGKLLNYCQQDELVRIMSSHLDEQNIPQNVLDYSNYYMGNFRNIPPEELSGYRIVVTTLILIGRYARKYHPDVVFIDEAAQASEPQANCAIQMLSKGRQIILAGDPKQLGPSICSRIAIQYGLEKSLLERLMGLPVYERRDPNVITMLKLNFRSHSTILRLPNELFYSNQLEARSTEAENDPLANVFVFKKIQQMFRNRSKKNKKNLSGQAIEFCNILSKESRQGRSPSYFNQKELLMVLKYIKALTSLEFEDNNRKVRNEEIGIVTPYIRQVYKLKEILRNNNIEGVEVGTCETFQGREKRVIIISTVRAQKDLLLFDKRYNLGFVKNEKRFNVAMTRAMSKLIVIGCANVLVTNYNWGRYVEFCEELEVYCGPPIIRRNQDYIQYIYQLFQGVCTVDSQHSRRRN